MSSLQLCTGFFVEREDFLHEIISEANLMTSFLKGSVGAKKKSKRKKKCSFRGRIWLGGGPHSSGHGS